MADFFLSVPFEFGIIVAGLHKFNSEILAAPVGKPAVSQQGLTSFEQTVANGVIRLKAPREAN